MPPGTDAASVNNNSASCDLPYVEGSRPMMALYITVLVVGLPANLLTVFLTWQQVRRKNVLGVYLWSLSLCDLIYLCTLPLWTDYYSRSHFWQWSSAACKVAVYIFFNNMYVSIVLLCCVSCDRYVAVAYSLEARGLRRRRCAGVFTIIVVLLVVAGQSAVFIIKEGDVAEGSHRCFEPSLSSTTAMGFSYARFVIGFLLPLVLLVVTNRSVLANVQRSTGLQPGQKQRVRWLAAAVILLFLVCFTPYHLILLARAIIFQLHSTKGDTCLFEKALYTPYVISLGLSTINSAINPILYVLSSNNIRKELYQGLTQVCRWAPSNSSQKQIQPSDKSLEPFAVTDAERQTPVQT